MKIAKNSSLETRMVQLLMHQCDATQLEVLREEYVVNKIRDLRNAMDDPIPELRLDGRDVLDLLRDSYPDEVTIDRNEKSAGGMYWTSDRYDIHIGNLSLVFCVRLRNGEECNATELYYGHSYLFNVIFMTPELVVQLMMQAADLYDEWMKVWQRTLLTAQRIARLKSLTQTAIVAYLKSKLINTGLQYYVTDHKECMHICLRTEWNMKMIFSVNSCNYRDRIDDAVIKVLQANEAMRLIDEFAKVQKVSDRDIWLTE